jgi:hypothetical protein
MKIKHAKERQRSKEYIDQMQYDAEVIAAILISSQGSAFN